MKKEKLKKLSYTHPRSQSLRVCLGSNLGVSGSTFALSPSSVLIRQSLSGKICTLAVNINTRKEQLVLLNLENYVFSITSVFSTSLCSVIDIVGPQRGVCFLPLSWRLNISRWGPREKILQRYSLREM